VLYFIFDSFVEGRWICVSLKATSKLRFGQMSGTYTTSLVSSPTCPPTACTSRLRTALWKLIAWRLELSMSNGLSEYCPVYFSSLTSIPIFRSRYFRAYHHDFGVKTHDEERLSTPAAWLIKNGEKLQICTRLMYNQEEKPTPGGAKLEGEK